MGRTMLFESAIAGECGPHAESPASVKLSGYELGPELGRGAAGVVYRAKPAKLDRPVALKVMVAARFLGEAARKRFLSEAEIAAHLDHPNIVPIYEVGEDEGMPFFAMKLIEGPTLADWLRQRTQPLTPYAAARLIILVAQAVHHAHQRGVLHRDLKPGNILFGPNGEPYVADFGLARRLDGDSLMTLSGAPMGTPAYMSPEQAAGKRDISVATDVWSLGAILYELLAGRPPFLDARVSGLLRRIAEDEPAPLTIPGGDSRRRANFRDLATICLKCLEKEAARRYASAQALADDLGRWLRDEPIRARAATTGERFVKWVRRRPAIALLSALAAGLFLAGLTGVVWQWQRANHSAAAAEAALRQTRDALWRANFDRAHAVRTSRQMGQRIQALDAVRAAAAIRPDPRLREEVIAALALTDFEDTGPWHGLTPSTTHVNVDPSMNHFAVSLTGNESRVHRFSDGALRSVLADGGDSAKVRFSDDGSLLVVQTAFGNSVWDWSRTNRLVRLPADQGLSLSPDGTRFARRSGRGGVVVQETRSQREVARFGEGQPSLLTFSPSGDLLALQVAGNVEIWTWTTRERLAQVPLPAPSIGLTWHPHRRMLAIGCEDRRLYLWDPFDDGFAPFSSASSNAMHRVETDSESPLAAAVLASIQQSTAAQRFRALPGHTREGVIPYFHPSGDLLVSSAWDGVLRLWDPSAGQQLLETKAARPIGFSSDGQWLAVRDANRVGRWRVHTPGESRVLRTVSGAAHRVWNLRFSPDNRFLAGVQHLRDVWLWDVASGELVLRQIHPGVKNVEFLDPNTLLVAGIESVEFWTNQPPGSRWQSRAVARMSPAPSGVEQAVPFNRGHLLLRHRDSVELREAGGGRTILHTAAQPYHSALQRSPDGRWIATGAWNNQGNFGGELWIWSAETGQPIRKWALGNCQPIFSPDGRWFVAAGAQGYTQFAMRGDPVNWTETRRFERQVPGFGIGGAAFSANGSLLALQVDDRLVRLIDADTGAELARLTPLADTVGELAVSPNGGWVAASAQSGVQVWDLSGVRARLREMALEGE
jgi:WD40 repeat protein/predicted Ser/Thr protein kinase